MISGILLNILGYILFIGFILCFLGSCIYLIICGIQEYLEEADWVHLLITILGCIGVMIITIIVLKTFGL